MVFQRIVNGFVGQQRVGGQGDEFFRSPINLPPLKIHQALAQGPVSSDLLARFDGGVDTQTACVGVFAILGKHHLPHSFGHKLGMQRPFAVVGFELQFLSLGLDGLLGGDVAVDHHAVDDVQLPRACAFGVPDGVEGRRRLGQTCQHRGFGDGDVFQGFAEISFSSRCKSIGPVAQKNLVHVDLENLVFGQQVLEFVGQQNLINFARVGFFG